MIYIDLELDVQNKFNTITMQGTYVVLISNMFYVALYSYREQYVMQLLHISEFPINAHIGTSNNGQLVL